MCGLGDENYDQFCQSGIEWDEMFEKLGGSRVVDRIECDVDYEDTAPEWITKALEAMSKVAPAPNPEPLNELLSTKPLKDQNNILASYLFFMVPGQQHKQIDDSRIIDKHDYKHLSIILLSSICLCC